MKKKLNDWLKKKNKSNISVPLDDNGKYDPNGKHIWTYYPYGIDEGSVDETTCANGEFPGVDEVIDSIIKHHNIK